MSPHSPGPVTNEESLYRLAFHPLHWDIKNKKPSPGLFDDATRRGASTYRTGLCSLAHAHEMGAVKEAADIAKGKERKYLASCEARTGDIRQLMDSTGRETIACVYDTALETEHSHADIFGKDISRTERQRLKVELAKLFGAQCHFCEHA